MHMAKRLDKTRRESDEWGQEVGVAHQGVNKHQVQHQHQPQTPAPAQQQPQGSATPHLAHLQPRQSSEKRVSGETCMVADRELGGGCDSDHDEGGSIARLYHPLTAVWTT